LIFGFCRPRNYSSGITVDNDLAYYESTDDGLSWVGGTMGPLHNVTAYANQDLERAYGDAAGAFTSDGRLHLFWVASFYDANSGITSDSRCKLRHWDESLAGANGPLGVPHTTVVRSADWIPYGTAGAFNRNICNLSVGVGDGSLSCPTSPGGSNLDYLYVLFTQFGSEDVLDMADSSHAGYQNGNLYLMSSPDGGHYWSRPTCMTVSDSIGGTPTRSPGCDASTGDSCFSERLGTLAPRVGSMAQIAYTADGDAGDATLGEGGISVNSFRYLRVSGDSAKILCSGNIACWELSSCGGAGDLNHDSVVDVFDVVASIDVTFAGAQPLPNPPGCPWDLSDVDCDGVTDVFDIIALIDYVFQGGGALPDPCACHQS
jgi:hypothetical protein